MEKIKFHFHSRDGFISKLVEWRTGSHISHVSIEVRGWHYNAFLQTRFYKTQELGPGVDETHEISVSKELADDAEKILNDFVGSLYDFKSLFGFLFNINRQSRGRVYCSEIANTILELVIPGEVKNKKLISPEDVRIALLYYNKGFCDCKECPKHK